VCYGNTQEILDGVQTWWGSQSGILL